MTPVLRIVSFVLLSLFLAACDGHIYVRDGVTDGDTFYLAESAFIDPDPGLQAWVAYSLDLSHCQLTMGGANPARNSSYQCELSAHQTLLDRYLELRAKSDKTDDHLEILLTVRHAGFLDEYLSYYFARRSWELPGDLDTEPFRNWRKQHLKKHRPLKRLIGSWNFKDSNPDV